MTFVTLHVFNRLHHFKHMSLGLISRNGLGISYQIVVENQGSNRVTFESKISGKITKINSNLTYLGKKLSFTNPIEQQIITLSYTSYCPHENQLPHDIICEN